MAALERSCFVPIEMEPSLNGCKMQSWKGRWRTQSEGPILDPVRCIAPGCSEPYNWGAHLSFVSSIWADPQMMMFALLGYVSC